MTPCANLLAADLDSKHRNWVFTLALAVLDEAPGRLGSLGLWANNTHEKDCLGFEQGQPCRLNVS